LDEVNMRILFVASRLHPNYSDSLCALAREYSVTVLVAWEAENERHENLSIYHFPDGFLSRILVFYHARKGLAPEQIAYRHRHPSLLWLIRFIRARRIDTIVARRDNPHLLRAARQAARLTGCRFLTYRQQILDLAQDVDRSAIYPLCAVLRVDEGRPRNFLPLCIDMTRATETSRTKLYRPDDGSPLRIIAVGKSIERKGHHLLIEAAAKLQDKLSLEVSIYGAYSSFHAKQFEKKLVELIHKYGLEDCVTLMPMIPPENMIIEHAKHHLFVYSGWVRLDRDPDSQTYGRANGRSGTRLYSLIEAMAAGLPVICASDVDVVGAVENGANGLVFEKGKADDLAAKIEAISRMNLAAMGARSRSLIEAHYNANDFPMRLAWLLKE
jgi:glycosyltransferase involved in cell wall biosynthesis